MARTRTVEKSARIALRADRSLRLAVVADTHSEPHPAMKEHLRSMAPDGILHAGDIGDLAVLDGLAAIAPVFAFNRGLGGSTAVSLADRLRHHRRDADRRASRPLRLRNGRALESELTSVQRAFEPPGLARAARPLSCSLPRPSSVREGWGPYGERLVPQE